MNNTNNTESPPLGPLGPFGPIVLPRMPRPQFAQRTCPFGHPFRGGPGKPISPLITRKNSRRKAVCLHQRALCLPIHIGMKNIEKVMCLPDAPFLHQSPLNRSKPHSTAPFRTMNINVASIATPGSAPIRTQPQQSAPIRTIKIFSAAQPARRGAVGGGRTQAQPRRVKAYQA